MQSQPILIAGEWRPAREAGTFRAADPAAGKELEEAFPISEWADVNDALDAAAKVGPLSADKVATFLNIYAGKIETAREAIVAMANLETALPRSPRLNDIELPRTTGQLRQAAAAALEGSWTTPTIDTKLNIRSILAPIGPVCVMGPNNFPLAFNAISGGDFAAAIAAGNPVIAKAHPSHPGTTRLLAEQAQLAARDAGLPTAAIQLIYEIPRADGLKLVADPRIGATAFTGSRAGGMALKASADAAGKPIYLEMSSLNPVVILPGAIAERSAKIADELADSALAASGQFCTKPGIVLLIASEENDFFNQVRERFSTRKTGPLLSKNVERSLSKSIETLTHAGAKIAVEKPNTLLFVTGRKFLASSERLQTEAFGNATMLVLASSVEQVAEVLQALEGNLTGCIYSASDGRDDEAYATLAPILGRQVGRLLNDKMPTGVAVSPAMNHGGPYPSTGHPGFTSVGIPASIRRFAKLQCYDNVRPNRLPPELTDANPNGKLWRLIDGTWTRDNVARP